MSSAIKTEAADARDSVVHKGDEVALAHEDSGLCREQCIHMTAEQLKVMTAEERLPLLQKANAHLVVATIKAHELADQLQAARDQMDYNRDAPSDRVARPFG